MPSGLANLLKAASEPTRLRILNLLRRGSICVCDLQALLGLPQPTVSRHLAVLRHAGLVFDFREGSRVVYSLAPPTTSSMNAFYEFLEKVCPGEGQLQKDLDVLATALEHGRCVLVERKEPAAVEARR
jgi:ArsR family transcriptional regulator